MKVAVLLSGCGVYDGAEIHESVFSLLSLAQNNLEYICIAPDINQYHVVNHINGEELNQTRNVLVESARISRGEIITINKLDFEEISSLVIPGGFGAAKNLSDWALNNIKSSVLDEVKELVIKCINNKKPIVSLCISPTILAKSLEGGNDQPELTVGSYKEESQYDISEINEALTNIGVNVKNKSINEIHYDRKLNIITAPCYMLDASIDEVYNNTKLAIDKLASLLV
jgi:enhancing lycopene biosynthesis protein 2